MDQNIKQSVSDRLKQANNVLVTVKKNPTVDHLAACIGLTLFLNKRGKHATAVFSGGVPSTLEFLKPENTIEKDTNSLRDFIIALDKSKADKLRYKVEDKVVKIFITPYRTSLSQEDLNFSQGDFNVDVVVALGVHVREELDQVIMAHGRILHDATVISINTTKAADLGALNWNDTRASSLSEMTATLVESIHEKSLDEQIATAFLTGIVAETDRFSNEKTSSLTMSMSAKLMAAGANQQLVATKLEEPEEMPKPKDGPGGQNSASSGTLEIDHPNQKDGSIQLPEPLDLDLDDEANIHIDDEGNIKTGLQDRPEEKTAEEEKKPPGRLAMEPPTMGGTLSANTHALALESSSDPLSAKQEQKEILSHGDSHSDSNASLKGVSKKPTSSQTLSSIEEQVDSPHVHKTDHPSVIKHDTSQRLGPTSPPLSNALNVPAKGIDESRKAIEQAAEDSINQPLQPIQALNAQPLGSELHPKAQPGQASNPVDTQLPPVGNGTGTSTPSSYHNTPPPVPPPMMPPSFSPPS